MGVKLDDLKFRVAPKFRENEQPSLSENWLGFGPPQEAHIMPRVIRASPTGITKSAINCPDCPTLLGL